ncbi:hypothetical protein ZWY2020_050960 [Hordeum vulgare]|nr:hypothetical protein ZWY2020_050960 [Hordeum vulgare]
MYARRDLDVEVVRTREDDTITSHIQDLEELISRMKEEMDHSLIVTHNLMTRKTEMEEELKNAHAEHEEEIDALQDKFDDLMFQLEEAEEKLDNGENLQEDHSYEEFINQDHNYEEDDEDIQSDAGVADISMIDLDSNEE